MSDRRHAAAFGDEAFAAATRSFQGLRAFTFAIARASCSRRFSRAGLRWPCRRRRPRHASPPCLVRLRAATISSSAAAIDISIRFAGHDELAATGARFSARLFLSMPTRATSCTGFCQPQDDGFAMRRLGLMAAMPANDAERLSSLPATGSTSRARHYAAYAGRAITTRLVAGAEYHALFHRLT